MRLQGIVRSVGGLGALRCLWYQEQDRIEDPRHHGRFWGSRRQGRDVWPVVASCIGDVGRSGHMSL